MNSDMQLFFNLIYMIMLIGIFFGVIKRGQQIKKDNADFEKDYIKYRMEEAAEKEWKEQQRLEFEEIDRREMHIKELASNLDSDEYIDYDEFDEPYVYTFVDPDWVANDDY